jgi:hypothetical protein
MVSPFNNIKFKRNNYRNNIRSINNNLISNKNVKPITWSRQIIKHIISDMRWYTQSGRRGTKRLTTKSTRCRYNVFNVSRIVSIEPLTTYFFYICWWNMFNIAKIKEDKQKNEWNHNLQKKKKLSNVWRCKMVV